MGALAVTAACAPLEGPGETVVEPIPIPPETQLAGDPQRGWSFLVNGNYIDCGVPETLYRQLYGAADAPLRLEGRDDANADLPYNLNAFTSSRGNRVVHPNCLSCHASVFRGQLVVGLGASEADFTKDATQGLNGVERFLSGTARQEFDFWYEHVSAVAPHIRAAVVGVNTADALGVALASHRDPSTLAWSDTALFDLPAGDPLPVDVPPWWRAKKKSSLYATGAGRGDHSRLMMLASTMCVDSVDVARTIADVFPDVRAAITEISPPAWPGTVDSGMVTTGQAVFETQCARCHGDASTYPNLFLPLELVGTDGALAQQSVANAPYLAWVGSSFYGETARMEPGLGYTAPPLDGVWATAPFLHNGSVPTMEALLDSSKRPERWRRRDDLGDHGYDDAAVGWHYDAVDANTYEGLGPNDKTHVYDTNRTGYGNGGHTFGDELTSDERASVIEYLKTL